jgi:hypothetical protein
VKNPDSQDESERRELFQRLRGSFSNVYMTLLSIIQGVALSDLASVVGNNYTRFTPVNWLLVVATLGMIVGVWHQITMDAISLQWIPDFRDAVLLFSMDSLELMLNHLIPLSLTLWLFTMAAAVCTLEVVGGAMFASRRAERAAKNTRLLSLIRRRQSPYLLHGMGGIAFFSLLGVFSIVEGLSASDWGHGVRGLLAVCVGVLAIAWVVSLFFITHRYWIWVEHYAKTGRFPDG